MIKDRIKRLLHQAEEGGGSYVIFILSPNSLAFISDAGKRKSTQNLKLTDKDMIDCKKSLKAIDSKWLVFNKLSKVEFYFEDGSNGKFERFIENDNVIRIESRKVSESKPKVSKWLVYSKNNGAVAFNIIENNNGKYIVIPTNGFIQRDYEIVKSDLLFGINGDISDIKLALSKVISDVIGMSINVMSLFSVLPSSLDAETEINRELLSTVEDTCSSYRPIFKTTEGVYVSKTSVFIGTKEITDLFPQVILKELFNGNKYWLEGCKEGSREEYLLMEIGITKVDRELFLDKIFDDEYLGELEKILKKQNDKWLRKFYIFCALEIYENKVKRKVYSGLKNIKCIKDSKGGMRYPSEVSLDLGAEKVTQKSIVIKKSLIAPGGKEDEFSSLIQRLFTENLGIGEFVLRPEIEQLVNNMAGKRQSIDRKYVENLIKLSKYNEKHVGEIDFSKYAIFPVETSKGLKRVLAEKLVIGKPYIKEGNLLVKALNRKNLWSGLAKLANEEELKEILKFTEDNGAIGNPRLIKWPAENHDMFEKELFVPGKHGKRDSSFDYTLTGLSDILKIRSLQLNKLVWESIISLEPELATEALYAEYSSNNREMVKRTDSTLINLLRKKIWIPDKNNKLHMPEDIKVSEINDDFRFDRKNPILKALGFGIKDRKNNEELRILKTLAKKAGMILVDEDEYQEFLKWKNKERK